MEKNLKVSIIVPVYNAQKYFEECIESLIKQTYKNIEIIIINDGSTDDSHSICQRYKDNDKRIIYLNKENEGVSATRNRGLNLASGQLMMFVDSDDYLDLNVIEKLVENYKQGELLCFGYKMIYVNSIKTMKINGKKLYLPKDDIVLNNVVKGYLWNKLFETNIIKNNNIAFDDTINFCEDLLFITNYLNYCKTIKYIPDIYYNYRIRKSSVTGNFCNVKNITSLKSYEKIIKQYDNNEQAKKELIYEYLFNYFRLKRIIKKEKNIKVRNDFLKLQKEVVKNKDAKEKVKFAMVKYFPIVYENIRALKKRNMFD